MEPKQKQHPVVDVTGDGSQVQFCREQYCIGTWNVRSMNQGKLKVVKQEMARVNINILGTSELKWTGMGEFNSDDHYIYYCGQESLRRNGVAIIFHKSPKCSIWCNLKKMTEWSLFVSKANDSISQNKTKHQVYAPNSHAEEAEVEWLYGGLKLNIQKTKIMASGPITSWQIDGETVDDFIFLGSKITEDGDYSYEIKRCLFPGRKAMTNLDSIFKSRDITLSTKVRLVKAMVFPVVMYGCESWTVKKAEHQRIDAFELWCLRRLLSPLDWREIQQVHPKGDQSWVFIGRIDAETETPNASAIWCEELPHLKRPWCWERLGAGGEHDDRGWDGWMVSPTQWTWVWMDSGSCCSTGRPGVLQFMGS